MARNSEKAMTALARWRSAHIEGASKDVERRPFLATDCDDVKKAERWRRQIISEISRKVAQIQNAGLGEFRLRDLNDEINKLLREKGHWEDRILELHGPDYRKIGPKMLDHEGKEVPGNKGYKYFGAAKDLPGVRELFEQEPIQAPRKTRSELTKYVNADYYGYRDEDDGVLVPLEQVQEKLAIAAAVADWKDRKEAILRGEVTRTDTDPDLSVDDDIYKVNEDTDEEQEEVTMESAVAEAHSENFIAHVPVPSQKQIEDALVRRKKMELLQKYASDALQAEASEARSLMGL